MYLEADIKVIKMYRKGEMRRKKCKERERSGMFHISKKSF